MKHIKIIALLLFFISVNSYAQITPGAGNILYVDSAATSGSYNGSSWANADTSFADVLHYARLNAGNWTSDSLRIYVAKGTYQPKYRADDSALSVGDRDDAFVMVKNVQLYGGYPTGGGIRNFNSNPTILNGDIGGASDTDNCYHIVIAADSLGNALMDGFAITKGYGNGSNFTIVNGYKIYRSEGAGINIDSTDFKLKNIVIANDSVTWEGGGIYSHSSIFTISNGIISSNASLFFGGGVYTDSTTSRLTNVIVFNNGASASGGGLLYTDSSHAYLNNALIYKNGAIILGGGICNTKSYLSLMDVKISNNGAVTGGGVYSGSFYANLRNVVIDNDSAIWGGGIYNDSAFDCKMTNVTIAKNSAGTGAGIYNRNSSPTINNSIIFGNEADTAANNIYNDTNCTPIFNYCIIDSTAWNPNWGINGAANITDTTNPFIAFNINFQLKPNSVAINSGSNSLYTAAGGNLSIDKDLADNWRLCGSSIDRGALEHKFFKPSAQNIVYVDSAIIGGNHTGNSWANAASELANALHYARDSAANWASDSLRIYVAKGTYFPKYRADSAIKEKNNQDDAFVMVKNVQIYGGFNIPIGDSTMTTRNWKANPTILSGDIGIPIDNSDNCYHVVITAKNVGNALLDGFTVTGGNAHGNNNISVNGRTIHRFNGGGIYNDFTDSTPKLSNLRIINNSAQWGGGMYNSSAASPLILNTTIANNLAQWGGGMENYVNSSTKLINVAITNNTALNNGGGIYNRSSSQPELINVLVTNNSAQTQGGGIYNYHTSLTLTNATIAYNTVQTKGGGMFNDNCSPTINNSIFYGNAVDSLGYNVYNNDANSIPVFTNCLIDSAAWDTVWGVNNGDNIMDTANPFISSANENYQLKCNAKAVGTGSNNLYIAAGGNINNDTDLIGNPRVFGNVIDMGAYESQDSHPIASFTANTINDSTVQINNMSINANSYIWNYGNGNSSNNAGSSFEYIYPKSDSTYTITLIASSNCGADTISQEVKLSLSMNIPSGITPNGDGVNDKWIIDDISADNSVTIFSRWGIVVWKAKNYDNNKVVWEGTNQSGANLPDATYYYLIKTKDKTFKGWINISR